MGTGTKTMFEAGLTKIKSTDTEGVGTIRRDEKGKAYRWVKNRNATAIARLAVCCYDADDFDGSAEQFEAVNMPVTNDLMLAAGVAMTAFGISGAICFGWIQVEGFCANVATRTPKSTAIAIGTELICENTVGTLARSVAAGTAPIYSNHFIAMEAIATDATGTATTACDVMIKCLG